MATSGAVIVDIQAKHSKFSKGVSTAQKDFKQFQKTVKSGVELFALVEGFGRVKEAVSSVNPQLGQTFKNVEDLVMISKAFGTVWGPIGAGVGAAVSLITSSYQSYMQDMAKLTAAEKEHKTIVEQVAKAYDKLRGLKNPYSESDITKQYDSLIEQLEASAAKLKDAEGKIGDDISNMGKLSIWANAKLDFDNPALERYISNPKKQNRLQQTIVAEALEEARKARQDAIISAVQAYATDTTATDLEKQIAKQEEGFLKLVAGMKDSDKYHKFTRFLPSDDGEEAARILMGFDEGPAELKAAAKAYLDSISQLKVQGALDLVGDDVQRLQQVETIVDDLYAKLRTTGIDEKQLQLLDLKNLGASPEQIQQVNDLLDQIASKERANQLKIAGEALADSLQTPVEQYKERLAELDELLEANAISQETYARAVKQAEDTMQGTARSAFALQDAGTVVRRFDFAMVQSPTKPSDPMQRMLSVEQQQLAQSQRQTKALERLSKGGLEVMSIAG
jgi:hypothetical protein